MAEISGEVELLNQQLASKTRDMEQVAAAAWLNGPAARAGLQPRRPHPQTHSPGQLSTMTHGFVLHPP
jgi:hypothetical protein